LAPFTFDFADGKISDFYCPLGFWDFVELERLGVRLHFFTQIISRASRVAARRSLQRAGFSLRFAACR
jgi:hypothetical protein